MKRCCSLAILLFLSCATTSDALNPPRATATSHEIQSRLLAIHNRIHSFYIAYHSVPEENRAGPVGLFVVREMAAYQPDRFYHRGAKGTPLYPPDQDPLEQKLLIDGKNAVVEKPHDRSIRRYVLDEKSGLPGTAPRDVLFLVLGWFPLRSYATPSLVPGNAAVLADIAKSNEYKVRDYQEFVSGVWCHVFEHKHHDCIWLDLTRNAIVAREVTVAALAKVVQRIDVLEHREVLPGLWVPIRFRNKMVNPDNDLPVVDTELRVDAIDVNQPPRENLFVIDGRPGVIELQDSGYIQRAPGGMDHLVQMAGIVALLSPPLKAQVDLSRLIWGTGIAFLVISSLASFIYFRSRRCRNRSTTTQDINS